MGEQAAWPEKSSICPLTLGFAVMLAGPCQRFSPGGREAGAGDPDWLVRL